MPDILGDSAHNIRSFTVRLGTIRVFQLAQGALSTLLSVTGLGLIWNGLQGPVSAVALSRGAVGLVCLAALVETSKRAALVETRDKDDVYGFYMWVWKLFYAAYILLPLAR